MMGQIYRSAYCVNIWIGEPGKMREVTRLSLLRRLYLVLLKTPFGWNVVETFHIINSICRNEPAKLEEAMHNAKPPYYSRAWVVQEFSLGQRLYLWCGSRSTKHSLTHLFAMDVPASRHRPELEHYFQLKNRLLSELPRSIDGGLSFEALVKIIDSTTATDPRDRVYAFVSLMPEEACSLIRIDYSLPCATIFAQATFANIKAMFDFGIFCFVNIMNSGTRDLPSWAMDFMDSPHGGDKLYRGMIHRSYGDEQLLKLRHKYGGPCLFLVGADRLLKFTGIIVDSIRVVFDFFSEESAPTVATDSLAVIHNKSRKCNVQFAYDRLKEFRSDSTSAQAHINVIDRVLRRLESTPNILDEDAQAKYVIEDIGGAWGAPQPWRLYWDEKDFIEALKDYYNGKPVDKLCLFTSRIGDVGIAPRDVVLEDLLVCVPGLGCFLVLRPSKDGSFYRFVGMAFIHGLHPEEFWQEMETRPGELKEFIVG